MISAASPLTCRARAPAKMPNPGLCSMLRQTMSPSRPPGTSTRCISASAADRSGKNCSPSWQHTTSNEPSASGIATALPSRHTMGAPVAAGPAALAAATASMPGFRSKPTTPPVRPNRCEANRATTPVPQATSRTRSPGFGSASATTSGAHGANIAGTSARS